MPNREFPYHGRMLTIKEAAKLTGVPYNTIKNRMSKYRLSMQDAVDMRGVKKVIAHDIGGGVLMTRKEIADHFGVKTHIFDSLRFSPKVHRNGAQVYRILCERYGEPLPPPPICTEPQLVERDVQRRTVTGGSVAATSMHVPEEPLARVLYSVVPARLDEYHRDADDTMSITMPCYRWTATRQADGTHILRCWCRTTRSEAGRWLYSRNGVYLSKVG